MDYGGFQIQLFPFKRFRTAGGMIGQKWLSARWNADTVCGYKVSSSLFDSYSLRGSLLRTGRVPAQ